MNITIQNTEQIVELDGVPARIWVGNTETGAEVHFFVTRVALSRNATEDEAAAFEKELKETIPPTPDIQKYDARLIL